jgi:hypothetical protein
MIDETMKTVNIETPDNTIVTRAIIRRSGYSVVRYKGYYHQILGGIRRPMFMSALRQGAA